MNKRLEKVLYNMKEEGLKQILVTNTASLYYLTGMWIEPHERMMALLIKDSGKAIFFGNELFGVTPPLDISFFCHKDTDDAVADLAREVDSGVLGIDRFWSSGFLLRLMALRDDVTPVLGSSPVDMSRMLKTEDELHKLKIASEINDTVMRRAIAAISYKETEIGLSAKISSFYRELGADAGGPYPLVCFGKNAADPHHEPNGTVLKKGDSIVMDIFTPIGRYWCDMTRTVFFNDISEKQKEVYELVRLANLKGIEAVKPGVPLSEIDRAAREVIEEAGYGKYFTHRLGHNIGIDCHEPPDVSSSSKAVALSGMVFSIEPGVYIPGEFGVRIEDLVIVTETGARVLNSVSKDLIII